jgi:hypothetical protein
VVIMRSRYSFKDTLHSSFYATIHFNPGTKTVMVPSTSMVIVTGIKFEFR